MKSPRSNLTKHTGNRGLIPALLITATLSLTAASSVLAGGRDDGNHGNPGIFPPQSHPYGKSYGEWAAAFWQWSLALPLEGHPFLDSPDDPYFDFSANQSGRVWFWSSPDGPLTRIVTMPEDKALFLTIRDVETSSLETVNSGFHGDTEAEQRANSKWFADHIVDVFCIIDGVRVKNLRNYRFSTPQFVFTAPTPWIFGGPEPTDPNIGGTGTSVGDGYFLMLAPLSKGKHTIHYGGTFHFTLEADGFEADFPHDVTIELTVGKEQHKNHKKDDDCDKDRDFRCDRCR